MSKEPDGGHLVAPELHAHGLGRAEGEEVQEAAAHRELAHLLHQRHPLEAPLLQVVHQGLERVLFAHLQGEPQAGQVIGHGGPLLERPQRGHEERAPGPLKRASTASTRRPPISRWGSDDS